MTGDEAQVSDWWCLANIATEVLTLQGHILESRGI